MIILKLKAGLGNQMFQYAYARALELRSEKAFDMKIDLRLDLRWFSHEQLAQDTERFYGLSHFNIKAGIATESEVRAEFGYTRSFHYRASLKVYRKIQREVFGFSDYVFFPGLARPVRKAYIDSYFWNSEGYFKDHESEIRSEFTLREPLGKAAESAVADIQAAVHAGRIPVLLTVRRGDYVSNAHIGAHHGAKDSSYYDKAIEEMQGRLGSAASKIHFFITTDDIPWVSENIKPADSRGDAIETSFLSREGMTDYEEMHVMSLCHHFIIANSTFHWWGAWLSTAAGKKIVIGPRKWVNDPKIDTRDVMPQAWIRL